MMEAYLGSGAGRRACRMRLLMMMAPDGQLDSRAAAWTRRAVQPGQGVFSVRFLPVPGQISLGVIPCGGRSCCIGAFVD